MRRRDRRGSMGSSAVLCVPSPHASVVARPWRWEDAKQASRSIDRETPRPPTTRHEHGDTEVRLEPPSTIAQPMSGNEIMRLIMRTTTEHYLIHAQ